MVHQRLVTTNIGNLSKCGLQPIQLIGERYCVTIEEGTVVNVKVYSKIGKDSGDKPDKRDKIQNIINEDVFLSSFSGSLEVLMNNFEFVIVDIMDSENSNIKDKTYDNRLKFMYENINHAFLIKRSIVHGIDTSKIFTPTIFRTLDSGYVYGQDCFVDVVNKDNVFVLVGDAEDKKDKILIPKKPYENLDEIPKILKKTFMEDDVLACANVWKDSLFENEMVEVIEKDGELYVEFDNAHSDVYLIAGKDANGKLKIFGKVNKKSSKIINNYITNTMEKMDSYIDWINNSFKNSFSKIYNYRTGLVVSCTTPKVGKQMSNVTVLDVRSSFDLNVDDIPVNIDNIPVVESVNTKRKFANIATNVIVVELISRLNKVGGYDDLVNNLLEFEKSYIVVNKRKNEDGNVQHMKKRRISNSDEDNSEENIC